MRNGKSPDAVPVSSADYRIEYKAVGGAADPESVYWHLFFRGEKVNGGISDNYELACREANFRKHRHSRDEWRQRYLWDEESRNWRFKSEFGL